ncbi:MAG TPA: hypothetical protein VEX60_14265 [Pyrinomonadaceae bacterium]|nr:hypothetical protein [Pyrinomonadaceae bacterium]
MLKSSLLSLLCALLVLSAASPALAQDNQKYNFRIARSRARNPATPNDRDKIDVRFGPDMPDDSVLQTLNKWLVFDIDQNGIKQHQPERVDVSRTFFRVTLHMGPDFNAGGNSLDAKTNKLVVQFKHGNFPSVTVGQPGKENEGGSTYKAAKGKSDADIYFSGEAATARESKPEYSIEAAGAYLYNIRAKRGVGKVDLGSIGVKGTFNSGSASSIDPDSITLGGTYRKLFVVGKASGFALNSDFIGFELDKENETRNLVTEFSINYVPSGWLIGKNKVASIDFIGGIEGGHNYKNALAPDGIGNFYRWKVGANTYFTIFKPFKSLARITYNTEYKLRLPQSAEIFSRTIDGEELKTLTRKPRHYAATDLNFMFSDAIGIALKHRYGSLPPAFNLVDNKVSVGLTLQLQQVNK